MASMSNTKQNKDFSDVDPMAESRKKDHIELAFKSQVDRMHLDHRFDYEPMLAGHPEDNSWPAFNFLGKTLRAPMWVSSMTGGTKMAAIINKNLARACHEFGMGMGLGSCRSLLTGDKHLDDFNVRSIIGDELPLYANLGIAQVEALIKNKETELIDKLIHKLKADGLIIHVNPLQEWLQPEGDVIQAPPVETIAQLLDTSTYPIIVKEVGQGFGPRSIAALLKMPLKAIDFAANGGTNFARLELLRSSEMHSEVYGPVVQLGHSAEEMVGWANDLHGSDSVKCQHIIISGGIKHFLDGYYLISRSKFKAIYGQASGFLKYARDDYETLRYYVNLQIKGLELCRQMLHLKEVKQ